MKFNERDTELILDPSKRDPEWDRRRVEYLRSVLGKQGAMIPKLFKPQPAEHLNTVEAIETGEIKKITLDGWDALEPV